MDRDPTHMSRNGGYLTPVEKNTLVEQPASTPEAAVDLVSPLQQTVDQAEQEVKEEKQEEKEGIKGIDQLNSLSQKKVVKRTTSKVYDQLSKVRKV